MKKATLLAGFPSIQEAMQHKGICRQRVQEAVEYIGSGKHSIATIQQHSTAHCCVLGAAHDGRHKCLCGAGW